VRECAEDEARFFFFDLSLFVVFLGCLAFSACRFLVRKTYRFACFEAGGLKSVWRWPDLGLGFRAEDVLLAHPILVMTSCQSDQVVRFNFWISANVGSNFLAGFERAMPYASKLPIVLRSSAPARPT
jgi:hypothetical protein